MFSSSRPPEPQSPPNQGLVGAPSLDLSSASIIRRPYFQCSPIIGNVDCSVSDVHGEVPYDLLAFAEPPELRDFMLLVHRYSLEPFMTPRRFFYPRVVIEFEHMMTSRREPNPTAIHSDIIATFNLSVVLANSVDYRQWPHPSPKEMVHILSRDTIAETILFRRQLPPHMFMIYHILQSNLFPLLYIA